MKTKVGVQPNKEACSTLDDISFTLIIEDLQEDVEPPLKTIYRSLIRIVKLFNFVNKLTR